MINIVIAQIIKYIPEYTIGNAVSYVNDENAQNKPATSNGVNQKNFRSLPDSIPAATERTGLTAKNKSIVTSIPASALTVFTVIKGMMSITAIIDVVITIALFVRFIPTPPVLFPSVNTLSHAYWKELRANDGTVDFSFVVFKSDYIITVKLVPLNINILQLLFGEVVFNITLSVYLGDLSWDKSTKPRNRYQQNKCDCFYTFRFQLITS